jgi:hypothetical protein
VGVLIQGRRSGKGICFMTRFIYNIVGISYAQVENSASAQNSVVALHQEHAKVSLFFYLFHRENSS